MGSRSRLLRAGLTLIALLGTFLVGTATAVAQNPDYSAALATNPTTLNQNHSPAPTFTLTITNLQFQTSKDLNTVTLSLPAGLTGATGVTISRTGWSSTVSADGSTIYATSGSRQADLPGGTTPRSTMTISFRATPTVGGTHAIGVVASNGNGVAISDIVVAPTFDVECDALPEITSNPSDQTATSGQTVTLTAAASNGASRRWQRSNDNGSSWSDVNGATSSSLTLSNVTTAMSGELYRMVASSSCDEVPSSPAEVIVNPITTTTTLANATATYGDATVTLTADVAPAPTDGNVTFSIDGNAVGTAPVVAGTATLAAPMAGLGAGTHEISADYGGTSEYTTSSDGASLVIGTATLTVTAADATRTYGDPNPGFTVNYDGFVNGENETVLGGTLLVTTPATPASGIGTHAINASGLTSSNYEIGYVSGTLTITPATLQIAANNDSREYGDANPAFSGSYSGEKNGESFSLSFTTSATASSVVGAYDIVPSADGATIANYTVVPTSGTLTITPATLHITADNGTREYGDANPSFTGGFTGEKNGESFTLSFGSSATATSIVGAYDIVPSVDGATLANYTVVPHNGTLTITPATLQISAGSASREYGEANPAFTGEVIGEKNGETFSMSFGTSATATSAVGSYDIVPGVTGATIANYTVVPTNGTLTITPATLHITAADKGREYGVANPVFTGSFSGEKNGETFTLSFSTTADVSSVVGAYDIVPSVDGATIANYTVVPHNGTLTIGTATLHVTANGASREYGDANPAFTGSFTGEKNGETFALDFSTPATPASNVGTYDIIPSITGATIANYTVVLHNGTLTVGPATLQIVAANSSREYGAVNPAFSGSYTGEKNGESFSLSFSTGADASSIVGTYDIVPGVTGATIANYTVVPTNGTLTITPATLHITAADNSREYGAANPVFTGSFSGEKNGETFTLDFSTPATPTSVVGAYDIVPSVTGATIANYAIVPHKGTLTIGPATLHITAANASREYGLVNPAFSGGFSGEKNGETFSLSFNTLADPTSVVGTYDIVPAATGATIANYTVAPHNGTLTITPATLTITAPSLTRTAGTPNPSLDGTFDGARNGETFTISGTTEATIASPIGEYPIIPSVVGATLANYTVNAVNGTLTVTAVCPTIESEPQDIAVCEGAPVELSVTAAGTGPFSYQWRHEGEEIPGATSATYSIAALTAGATGLYDVVVSAYCTPVTSRTVRVSIELPTIVSAPTNTTVCAGQSATFSIVTSGGCATYQWRRNGEALSDDGTYSGVTTSTLTIDTAEIAMSGTFDVLVNGQASTSALLTVNPTFSVTATPSTLKFQMGKLRTITTKITGGTNCQAGTIVLESITANETIARNDIFLASFNTTPADLSFYLAANRNTTAPRVYTIRYKATDANGRVSYATTTVTVPTVGGMKPTSPEEEVDAVTAVTGSVSLEQNIPNPFNGTTEIRFLLPITTNARVTIFDMKGRVVTQLLDEERAPGLHFVRWNGELPSGRFAEAGTYVYRLETALGVVSKTMSLVR